MGPSSPSLGVPPPLTHFLDYGANFSPLLNWNGLENGCGVPPECELSPYVHYGPGTVTWEPQHPAT